MRRKTLICGIDPGLASGGLVVIDHLDADRVLESVSLVEKRGAVKAARAQAEDLAEKWGGWGDMQFTSAVLRSEAWCERVQTKLDEIEAAHGPVDFYAIESFVDQPSRARQDKAGLLRGRWQTPLSTGSLAVLLAARGADVRGGQVIYQNAGVVIPQWRSELAQLEASKGQDSGVAPDDHKVGNDHERKAFIHALSLSIRLRSRSGKTVPAEAHTTTFKGRPA